MHIYKNISKLFVFAVVTASFGCQTDLNTTMSKNINSPVNETDKINNQNLKSTENVSLQNYQVRDWTNRRIANNFNSFKTKSAADNLKIDNAIDIFPQSTDNKYLLDPAKLISGNNTSLSGRVTTDGTTKEVLGTLTYISQDATKTDIY